MEDDVVAISDMDIMEELFMATLGFDFSDYTHPGPLSSPLFDVCSSTTTATPPPPPASPAAGEDDDRAAEEEAMGPMVKERLRRALERIASLSPAGQLLAQVWVPTAIDGRKVLTTLGQPFWLGGRSQRLASYRSVSVGYQFAADESSSSRGELGLPGRVFVGRVPEWTPDVRYFSTQGYPRVHHAQQFDIRGSVALPVFEPRARTCLSVVELVMTT